jgi:hypothetical protein
MNKRSQIKNSIKAYCFSFWKSIVVACIFIVFSNGLGAQVDCNTIMVCNDLVQVSLGTNCTETVTADMILEGQPYPNSDYVVKVQTPNGSVISGNVLTKNSIGKTYQVIVTLDGCDLSCWGNIVVEDKLPPVISACPSVNVKCGASTAPGTIAGPTATDACGGAVTLKSNDKEVLSQCTATYVKVITRTWTATDLYGNKSTCQQIINVIRPKISDVSFPRNYDDIDLPAFTCGAVIDYLPNGAPSPSVTGTPGGTDCANIMYFHKDIIFNICGSAKKVLREWTVIDWCTGKDTVVGQVIKILDKAAPVCVSPPDFKFNINTDEGKCTGTFKVPAPNVIYECSKYDYIVGYKLRTANGTPFVNPIFDNVTKTTNPDGTYFYTIKNLPADTSWIVYQLTDACGNYSECFTEVIVKDIESPSAVCEGFTVITLEEAGVADLYASSLDDGSSDNCGVQKFQIKRNENKCGRPEDLQFRDKVVFCCNDLSSNPNVYQKVTLRVFDKSGNYSDCSGNVKVQDKKAPTISAPGNVTVGCDVDYKNLALTGGRATGFDACLDTVTFADSGTLKCGLGVITRTWTARDKGGLTATKVQLISIIDNTPFVVGNINWPADLEVNGCQKSDATPEKLNSKPTYVNADCADIAISFDDELFNVPGACLKILRTWRVINWCNANAQNPVFFTHVQKITLKNSVAPVIVSGCGPRTITSTDNDCEEYVEHTITATDDCTPSDLLKYTWKFDRDNNGSVDETGTGNFYAKVYPAGKHKMTFTVKDICENATECSYIFTIKDNKAPTPICNTQVTWVLDEMGKAVVWASDFNLKSFDACNGENLTYSFSINPSESSKMFSCADVPNGLTANIPLKMYAFDKDGNSEFCSVILILQDSPTKNACPNTTPPTANISGRVLNKIAEGFDKIEVSLENTIDKSTSSAITTDEGEFKFENVEVEATYNIVPKKSDDLLNGVSTLDLVLIQRHILGLKSLENPYDIIAADINKDKKITAADLVGLRKIILGVDSKFNANTPWRFVPTAFSFADPKQPYEFPTGIEITKPDSDLTNLDFTTVKVGDVNNSATYNFRNTVNVETRTSPIILVGNDINFKAGEAVNYSLMLNDFVNISGLQMALNFDENELNFEGITSSRINITKENYNVTNGVIRISLDLKNSVIGSEGDEVITLNFKSKTSGNLSSITAAENVLTSELYDNEYNIRSLKIELQSSNVAFSDNTIKALPNPFSAQTQLSVSSNSDGIAYLKVLDVTGKIVYSTNEQMTKGNNKITIKKENLGNKNGMYFYQVELNSKLHTGAMILSE